MLTERGRPDRAGRPQPASATRRGGIAVELADGRAGGRAATCWWRPDGTPTPTCSGPDTGWRPTSAGSSPSTTASRPRSRASGRSATSTVAAPSPTPRTRTRRSYSPRRVRSTDRVTTYAMFTDPPLGRVGMTVARRASRAGRCSRPRCRWRRSAGPGLESETTGVMRVLVDADTEEFLGRHDPRAAGRRRRAGHRHRHAGRRAATRRSATRCRSTRRWRSSSRPSSARCSRWTADPLTSAHSIDRGPASAAQPDRSRSSSGPDSGSGARGLRL